MYSKEQVNRILKGLVRGAISRREAFSKLKDLPYLNLNFAKLDSHRQIRRGFPEVIFGAGKSASQMKEIAAQVLKRSQNILMTRVQPALYEELRRTHPSLKYDEAAGIVYKKAAARKRRGGLILIITAGTSDIPVAEEARCICELMGERAATLYDVGVAGIHRLTDYRHLIQRAKVIIVVAGMEGALASVIGGLVSAPIVAVPTSVGYGASFRGVAPLLTMMNSCVPGIAVVNIDNGFGAGYFASLINR